MYWKKEGRSAFRCLSARAPFLCPPRIRPALRVLDTATLASRTSPRALLLCTTIPERDNRQTEPDVDAVELRSLTCVPSFEFETTSARITALLLCTTIANPAHAVQTDLSAVAFDGPSTAQACPIAQTRILSPTATSSCGE
ncbi:hypothetical protein EXIGLDRAFT_162000 [Exidia glandulosa HHB12029]|uniref:Uncharacterized protein n=1 Tax=Exidia glandulosa HHB12029 TaxID=1314781 RepID=A0A165FH48_EXIGL|nr:hypothetical protein EXIGLDRAFT_162000 [Exidia glandulosa HHB12029]